MNERIFNELYKKAWGHFPCPTGEPELEKFAEAIVKECMRMCDVAAIGYDTHGLFKEANGASLAKVYIADWFEIEEDSEVENDDTVTFAGVPLVRIIKIKRKWQVQMRDDETSDAWTNIGEPFFSREKAIEEAPYLCEF